MPTRIIRSPEHIAALSGILTGLRLPVTVSWTHGASRSSAQNRLSHRWYADIARQLGDRSADEVRAECKVAFGVPIMREENEAFRVAYDRALRDMSYEERVAAVCALDLPVTRLMTPAQMTVYLDAVARHWLPQGVRLTEPDAIRYEEEFGQG